ncbi:MAG: hypothetical protein J6O04_08440 [Selenomonadaceae bacterium]|nr:hypothetical protein [Selenomonadaceae bacterium]
MAAYRKPAIISTVAIQSIIPLAAVGGAAASAIGGLSAAKLAVVGVAAGLGLSRKGSNIINSFHTRALNKRKVSV